MTPASTPTAAASSRSAVRPGLLLDVDSGELQPGRAVLVADGRVVAVVDAAAVPPDTAVVDLPELTVLPGLIDCHAHLVGEPDSGRGYAELIARTPAQEAMSGVRNARDTLRAGFTTVRDVGTFRAFVDVALRDAIEAGWLPGPRMRVAGGYLTCSGGGGDITGLATDVDAVLPRDLRIGVADTVDEARRAVRRLVGGGADFIKVIATGAVMTEGTTPGAPELTQEQLDVIVEEAALLGVDVAAHAHGAEGIKRAVRAGVRSIEHGSLMDDEAIAMMAESRTFLVADVYCGDYINEQGLLHGWSPNVMRKNDETTVTQREGFAACVKAGVRIAFGTDSGIYPHGWNARQFAYQVRYGQSPLEAIRSATTGAAELLRMEDHVGRVTAGRFADLVGVAGDPLEDVRLLEDVRFVMKAGEVVLRP
jgi:imidazolonepropionase-like amidohydrolase